MQDMEKPETRKFWRYLAMKSVLYSIPILTRFFAFSRGCALITDLSNIVLNHSPFLCRRPGIYFSPWQTSLDSLVPVGWRLQPIHPKDFWTLSRMALENPREEAEIIERNREKELMPFESAFDENCRMAAGFL